MEFVVDVQWVGKGMVVGWILPGMMSEYVEWYVRGFRKSRWKQSRWKKRACRKGNVSRGRRMRLRCVESRRS
jgi:hypothetical protein